MKTSLIVFFITFLPILLLIFLAKKDNDDEHEFGGDNYGKWMVGLSAGATGNSGFIMTGAVGLGYLYGLQWVLLPLAWFLGDLIFWRMGPEKLNDYSSKYRATNIIHIIAGHGDERISKAYILSILILAILMCSYIASQWVAGSKIVSEFVGISSTHSIWAVCSFVTIYSFIGKFRGSIYTDMYQAILMLFIVTVSLVLILMADEVSIDQMQLSDGFSSLTGSLSRVGILGFVVGYAFASFGFGFAQPQITTRYMAAKNSEEVKGAKWIYIIFLQYTWIGMTIFGYLLRVKLGNISDPEAGVIEFFNSYGNQFFLGLAAAAIIAAITSTVDSILVSISSMCKQVLVTDKITKKSKNGIIIVFFGVITGFLATNTSSNVFELALIAISMIGASFCAPVVIRVYSLRSSENSIFFAIVLSLISASIWKYFGYSSILNEAFIGICIGFLSNYVFSYKKACD